MIRAAAEVESSWQHAVQAQAAKLALDADVLALNAESYLAADADAGTRLGGG